MKNFLKPLAALSAAVLLAACAPAIDPLGKNNGNENHNLITTTQQGVTSVLSLSSVTYPGGGVKNTADQRVVFSFNHTPDAGTVAGGITFYKLSNNANSLNTELYTYTAFAPSKTEFSGKTVTFTFDLSGYTFSRLYYHLNPSLTGNNGDARLSADGNTAYGEASDLQIDYLPVVTNSSGTPAVTGLPTFGTTEISPATTVSFTATNMLAGNSLFASYGSLPQLFTFNLTDSRGLNNFSTVELAKAFTVYKNVGGVWSSSGITCAVSAGPSGLPQYQLTFTPAPQVGEAYKVVVDKSKIKESSAVLGFVHAATYSWDSPAARQVVAYQYYTNTGAVAQTAARSVGFSANQAYINLTPANPIDLDANRLNKSTLKVYVVGTDTAGVAIAATFPYDRIETLETTTIGNNDVKVLSYRIYLPATIATVTSGHLRFAPTVLTESSGTLANSQVTFGDPTNTANDGWGTSFTF